MTCGNAIGDDDIAAFTGRSPCGDRARETASQTASAKPATHMGAGGEEVGPAGRRSGPTGGSGRFRRGVGRPDPMRSARLGSARLGSARLGSARLGSARLGNCAVSAIFECQAKLSSPGPVQTSEHTQPGLAPRVPVRGTSRGQPRPGGRRRYGVPMRHHLNESASDLVTRIGYWISRRVGHVIYFCIKINILLDIFLKLHHILPQSWRDEQGRSSDVHRALLRIRRPQLRSHAAPVARQVPHETPRFMPPLPAPKRP